MIYIKVILLIHIPGACIRLGGNLIDPAVSFLSAIVKNKRPGAGPGI